MKITFFALCILLLSSVVYGQSNFRPGYLITQDNDSIAGYINFKKEDLNSSICRFKKDEISEEEQVFTPNQILGYRFTRDGKYYLSSTIKINGENRSVFLEYLVKGIMDLYYYKDPENDLEYYFFNENGKVIPISKKPDEEVGLEIKKDVQYKVTINQLFKDVPSHEDVQFKKRNMINIVRDYHKLTCTTGEECITFENDYKKKFYKTRFSIYTGVLLTRIVVPEDNTGSSNSLYPMIGGLLNIYNPVMSKSFSLEIDASLSGLKGRIERLMNVNKYEKYEFDAMLLGLKVKPRYTYHKGKFRPTTNVGIGFSALIGSSNTYHTEYSHNTSPIVTIEDLSPRGSLLSVNCGIGFDYLLSPTKNNFLFCHLEYDYAKSRDTEDKFKYNVNMFQLKVGYSF